MSDQDLAALEKLTPDRFEYPEWVALQWLRQNLEHGGNPPDRHLAAEFQRLFSPARQTDIVATFKLMLFSNMLVNTFSRSAGKAPAACNMSGE